MGWGNFPIKIFKIVRANSSQHVSCTFEWNTDRLLLGSCSKTCVVHFIVTMDQLWVIIPKNEFQVTYSKCRTACKLQLTGWSSSVLRQHHFRVTDLVLCGSLNVQAALKDFTPLIGIVTGIEICWSHRLRWSFTKDSVSSKSLELDRLWERSILSAVHYIRISVS